MENFVELTFFFNPLSCGSEAYSFCKFEDEEHFGEVEANPSIEGGGMRLTVTFSVYCPAPFNTNDSRLLLTYLFIVKFNRSQY